MSIITNPTIEQIYDTFKMVCTHLRFKCSTDINAASSGDIGANQITDSYLFYLRSRTQIAAFYQYPGLAEFAANVEAIPGYDLDAEITTLLAAIDASTAWIEANFPTSNGWILAAALDSGITWRQFTTAQTAGLVTELADIVAAIDARTSVI